jgi:hypothetical protein
MLSGGSNCSKAWPGTASGNAPKAESAGRVPPPLGTPWPAENFVFGQLTPREQNENIAGVQSTRKPAMPQSAAPNPQADADRLEAAADDAIAACGGDLRNALKALIVANEYLESEVCELMQAVSHAYARGRFKTYTG